MIPYTFPSIVQEDGVTACRVKLITDITGLVAWTDYTPIKFVTDATFINTYENAGSQALDVLTDVTGLVSGVDYILIYEDASATKPWSTDIGGYIPCFGDSFSPIALFANGEQGVFFDPSDLTTLYQDSSGTTPVTAVEQPVGLMLDKSKGLALGPELVTNGDFSSSTGWFVSAGWSISGGTLNAVSAGSGTSVYQNVVALGKYYELTFTIVSISDGAVFIRAGDAGAAFSEAGTHTVRVFNSNDVGIKLRFNITASGTTTCVIDDISCKELPGNHAFQTTSASRPVLSARVNLLTKTEQFDDVVWNKVGVTIAANTANAPDGTLTADLLRETAGNNEFGLYQLVNLAGSYTRSFYIKQGIGERLATVRVYRAVNDYLVLIVNPATGESALKTGSSNTFTNVSFSVVPASNGFYQASLTYTASSTVSFGHYLCTNLNPSLGNNGVEIYKGDGTSGIYIWGADLRVANDGTDLPAYQRVNTATDYDTTGFPLYLRTDGVDDGMVTNTIDFTATDKMTVCAGVRKLSDAATAILTELSATADTNAGTFYLGAPSSGGVIKFSFNSRGSVLPASPVGTASSTYSAPVSSVVAAIGSISEDARTVRLNSTEVATGGGVDQGTGNYGNYPLYLFRRGGTSLPFNGRFYGMTVVNKLLETAQLEQLETYTNGKTKAF